jgi:hypothetical protein
MAGIGISALWQADAEIEIAGVAVVLQRSVGRAATVPLHCLTSLSVLWVADRLRLPADTAVGSCVTE